MTQNTSHAVMAQRHESSYSLDDFPTPTWAGRALCEYVIKPKLHGTCWEPACNRGFLARGLENYFAKVYASDVEYYGYGEVTVDFFKIQIIPAEHDWIITNPPFRLAEEFTLHALKMAKDGVAMLTRTAFLESAGRYKRLFSVCPPTKVAQFVERVPMVKGRCDPNATTATAYCWIVWEKPLKMTTEFMWIPPCRKKLERPGDYDL